MFLCTLWKTVTANHRRTTVYDQSVYNGKITAKRKESALAPIIKLGSGLVFCYDKPVEPCVASPQEVRSYLTSFSIKHAVSI